MAILVPYDGSPPAQQALEYAIDDVDDEEIVLLRVVEAASGSLEAGIDLLQEKFKQLEQKKKAELSEEVDTLTDSVDFRTETAVGDPANEIVAFAENNDVEEIIIGSHARSGISSILLGSVAERVVRRAPVTVTVVR